MTASRDRLFIHSDELIARSKAASDKIAVARNIDQIRRESLALIEDSCRLMREIDETILAMRRISS